MKPSRVTKHTCGLVLVAVMIVFVAPSYCDANDVALCELGGCPGSADREQIFASLLLKGRQSLRSRLDGDEPLFFVRLRDAMRVTTNREDRLRLAAVMDELGQGDPLRWAFDEGARSLQRTIWPKPREGAVYRSAWAAIQHDFYASWAHHSLYAAGENVRRVGRGRSDVCIMVIEEAMNRDVDYAAHMCRQLDESDSGSRRAIGKVLRRLRLVDDSAAKRFVIEFRGRIDPWSREKEPPWRLVAGELFAQEEAEGDAQRSWYSEFEQRVGASDAVTIKRDVWIGRGRVRPQETLLSLIENRSYIFTTVVMDEWVERDLESASEFLETIRTKIPVRIYMALSLQVLNQLALGDPEGAVRKVDALVTSAAVDAELQASLAGARDVVLDRAIHGIIPSTPARAMDLQSKVSEQWLRTKLAFEVMSIWGEKDLNAAMRVAEIQQGDLKEVSVAGVLVSADAIPFPDRMRAVMAVKDRDCRVRALYGLFARTDVQESVWSSVLSLSGESDEWTAAICGLAQSLLRKRNETLRIGSRARSEVGRESSPDPK
jgi:hypothetical protein